TDAARADFVARMKPMPPGTVGAVALDRAGHLAAATSTGGTALKLAGRVGDSPFPGAGTYAGHAAAVSATGKGELVMRVLAAKRIHDLTESGSPVQAALERSLREMQASVGSGAGFIAVAHDGQIGMCHDTTAMLHAWCSEVDREVRACAKANGGRS